MRSEMRGYELLSCFGTSRAAVRWHHLQFRSLVIRVMSCGKQNPSYISAGRTLAFSSPYHSGQTEVGEVVGAQFSSCPSKPGKVRGKLQHMGPKNKDSLTKPDHLAAEIYAEWLVLCQPRRDVDCGSLGKLARCPSEHMHYTCESHIAASCWDI